MVICWLVSPYIQTRNLAFASQQKGHGFQLSYLSVGYLLANIVGNLVPGPENL